MGMRRLEARPRFGSRGGARRRRRAGSSGSRDPAIPMVFRKPAV